MDVRRITHSVFTCPQKVDGVHNHIIVHVVSEVERTPARRPSKTKDPSGLGLC